jgi:hypothetical protein
MQVVTISSTVACPYMDIDLLASCFFFVIVLRDGNEDPIPDSPREILLLGDGYGTNLVPTGI